MVYKIFPSKDSSLYSAYPSLNTGIDEILSISTFFVNSSFEVSRAVIQFSDDDIKNTINLIPSASNYNAYIRLYLADASEIPLNYTVYANALSQSWDMGTGRFNNNPETTNGVSWIQRTNNISWSLADGGDYYSSLSGSQSFEYNSNKDIEIDITNIVKAQYNYLLNITSSVNIPNNGIIIKHSDSLEFISGSVFELNYFSMDTHTIYPPCLEIRWDDSSYITGSNSLISGDSIILSLQNNTGVYKDNSVNNIRIGVRKQFPTRTFQTSSIYTNNFILPSSSYWSIKDYKTEDIIVDFDDNYTKISCDKDSNFFKLYAQGLEPERFYKFVFKSVINDETFIFDNDYIFKIIR